MSARVVLVAGAGGPIGRAIADRCAELGATVVRQRHRPRHDESDNLYHHVDLTDQTAVAALAEQIQREHGPVHALVNAAHPGHPPAATVGDLTSRSLDESLDGLRMYHHLCRYLLPQLRSHGIGRIVFLSGALARRPVRGQGGYAVAKAAGETLTRYLAAEEGRSGVTANVVSLGRIIDPADPAPPAELAELEAALRTRLSQPDFPTTGQVADVVTGLLTGSCAAVTGQTLWVTGGEPML